MKKNSFKVCAGLREKMKKLIATVLLIFVVVWGASLRAQLIREKPRQEKPQQENLMTLQFRANGIILSVQGEPDRACEWDNDSPTRAEFGKQGMAFAIQWDKGITLEKYPWNIWNKPAMSCHWRRADIGTLD